MDSKIMTALGDRVLTLGPQPTADGPYRHFKLTRDADGVAQTSLASIRPCTLEMVSRMAASITGSDVDFGRHPQMPRAASALGTCSGKASASTRMRCGARRSRACSSCAHPEAWSPGMPKTSSSAFR